MESSNFNLDQSISNYINLISNQGSITRSDAAELSGHLYDATEALIKQGLSAEESFLIACKRLGNETLLAEEYSKVNTSVKTNRIWAYLFVGFNLFSGLWSLVIMAVAIFYFLIFQHFNTSGTGTIIVTTFHILFTAFLWYTLKYKRAVSHFIEKQVEQNPVRLVCITFIPQLINLLLQRSFREIDKWTALRYPVYAFQSSWVEFSFLVAVMTILAVVVGLIFSINKVENLSLKSLFQKPTIPFLLVSGLLVELLAASTRAIRTESMVVHAFAFGLIYMAASFLIAYYNESRNINKYLMVMVSLGLILEITVGSYADMDRGNTYYTVYFVAGLLSGVMSGRFLGARLNHKTQILAN